MKEEALDLANMTVEDLFQAKTERRLRLANLPFEKKIEIVRRLQSVTPFNRDERVKLLAKLTLEKAGHKNVTVKCVSYGDADDVGVKAGYESAGTWTVGSNHGSFSFSLTVDEYNRASDEQIEAVILRSAA